MDRNLAMELVRVTEAAALASARFMGRGDEAAADMAAIEAMKKAFGVIAIDGTVVIGEGAEDAMPMLYVGERVGTGQGPATDVALDALEGAHICAVGGYNAMSVIAIAEHGTFLRVPDTYMEKIACGPEGRGVIDLDKSPTANLQALAEARSVYVEDLTVAVLDRPRHDKLIEEVRRAGARIKLHHQRRRLGGHRHDEAARRHRPAARDRRRAAGHPRRGGARLPRRRDAGAAQAAERARGGALPRRRPLRLPAPLPAGRAGVGLGALRRDRHHRG